MASDSTEGFARAFAPASVGNVACGFDVLGLALEEPGDEVVARFTAQPGVRITRITGDDGRLPTDAASNTASVAARALLQELREERGIELEIHKNMPMGSGLGSSAASAVAGVVAVNHLLGRPLSRRDLLPFTLKAEKMACGAAHADNVAASLLGGIVLCRPDHPANIIRLPVPDELICTLIRPHIEIKTGDARAAMPDHIAVEKAVAQLGYIGGFIAGLYESDYELIAESLQDEIAEPARASLIPGFREVQRAARASGALGCSISGAGPSIFALSRGLDAARSVKEAMDAALHSLDISSTSFISPVNMDGATIIEQTSP